MNRPLGITLIAGLLAIIGGFSSFWVLLQFLDHVQLYGFASVMVQSFYSMLGFLLYGALPVLFYATGVGLWQLKFWALQMTITIIPPVSFFWLLSFAHNLRAESVVADSEMMFVPYGLGIYIVLFLLYAALMISTVSYLNRPEVRELFV